MTLGLWVKDYLYIPMGGNEHGKICKMRNLFISMLIIGLWHGAGWTFVFWGGLHGGLLMINHQWRRLKINLPKVVNWLLTFSCVVVGWVFFRAANFHDAVAVLSAMTNFGNIALPASGRYEQYFGFLSSFGISFISWNMSNSLSKILMTLIGLEVILLACPNPQHIMESFKPNKKWLIVLIVLFVYSFFKITNYSEFLYFQF